MYTTMRTKPQESIRPLCDNVHIISQSPSRENKVFEWFNPLYAQDKENNFKTRNYAETKV